MTRAKILAWFCGIYLVALLIFTLLAGYPISWWLLVAVIVPLFLTLYLRLTKRYWNLDNPKWLTNHIRSERWVWYQLEKTWIGRQVLLKEDIRNSNEPEGLQVYVRAGTVGEIVGLNRDARTPFTILFPGFAHKVVVHLEKLDVNPAGNPH